VNQSLNSQGEDTPVTVGVTGVLARGRSDVVASWPSAETVADRPTVTSFLWVVEVSPDKVLITGVLSKSDRDKLCKAREDKGADTPGVTLPSEAVKDLPESEAKGTGNITLPKVVPVPLCIPVKERRVSLGRPVKSISPVSPKIAGELRRLCAPTIVLRLLGLAASPSIIGL
tara:strand:- start:1649 stop:2164 length:516 start_codon:yes stop_codon:yes gene_type:complete